jgi:hypothetical protein
MTMYCLPRVACLAIATRFVLRSARAAFVGPEVVGLVEVDALDRVGGDEAHDLDLVGLRSLDDLEFFLGEEDVLVLGELVALHDLFLGHHGAVGGIDVLLAHAHAALLPDHVEGDFGPRLARGIDLHREGDQPEGDGRRSDRARCHGPETYVHGRDAGKDEFASARRANPAQRHLPPGAPRWRSRT